jgi:hypothetical protein
MKTTESRRMALVAAALCGFFFGLGGDRAGADPVLNCPLSICEDLFSWWIYGSGVISAQGAGSPAPPNPRQQNTTNGFGWVYVPATTGTKGGTTQNGTFDRYVWTGSTDSCINADKSYPSPQMVMPSGTATLDTAGVTRFTCNR